MRRRTLLASTGAIALTAGCLSVDENRAKSIGKKTDLTVNDWRLDGDVLLLEYQTSGTLSKDVEELATAYADVVAGGVLGRSLNRDLRATGVGASNTVVIEIGMELAKEYNGGDLSKSEYLEQVRP